MNDKSYTLWVDVHTQTYYHIPNTTTLVAGDTTLLNLQGQQQQVAANSIEPYKITQAEAEKLLQTDVQTFLQDIGDSFANLLTQLLPSSSQTHIPATAVNLLAQLTGSSPEALRRDPRLAQKGLQTMIAQLANLLEQSFTTEQDAVEQATQTAQILSQRLDSAGLTFNQQQLEALPYQLHQWYNNSSDKEGFADFVTELRQFSQATYTPSANWQTILTDMRQVFNNLLVPEDPSVAPYNRGRQAVRDNMKTHTFDFKKVWAAHQAKKDDS